MLLKQCRIALGGSEKYAAPSFEKSYQEVAAILNTDL
jgi:hypothetical protein